MLLCFSEEQAIELELKIIHAHIGCLAVFGSEKSIASKVIAEGFFLQRIPLIIFDPRFDIISYLIDSQISKQDLSKFETRIKLMPTLTADELMQIVPDHAGSDPYDFLNKANQLSNENYLYESINNKELRMAYFQILSASVFRKANDLKSRLYFAIATYNTDAGNLSRAFIAKTKLNQTFPKIYEATADQAYQYFEVCLPEEQTQRYTKWVSSPTKVFAA